MTTISTVTLAGNLTRDPEIRLYPRWPGPQHPVAGRDPPLATGTPRSGRRPPPSSTSPAGGSWRRTCPSVSPWGLGSSSPVDWSSTAGRPKAGTAGRRWRSWPTTSGPASGFPRPRSIGPSATTVPRSVTRRWHPPDRLIRLERRHLVRLHRQYPEEEGPFHRGRGLLHAKPSAAPAPDS
jgi:hypothetical protein